MTAALKRAATRSGASLALGAICILLASCTSAGQSSSESGDEAILHVARAESFEGWDPDRAAAYGTFQTLQGVLEPLVRVTPDGTGLAPGLAESWTFDPAALTWTFVLRDRLLFSDGSDLTSEDVAFSADVWAEGPNVGSLYANIASIATPDDRTVVFSFSTPDTTFPVLMTWSSSAIFPSDFGGKTKDEYFAAPVAAGAFVVADWSPGGKTILEKNPHYYEPGRPYLDRVVIDVLPDATERSAQYLAGQIDISEYVSPIDAAAYGEALVALPASQVEHLSFNTTRAPLDDERVRQGIAYAIDYESIIAGAFKGYGSEPQGIVPPNLENWVPPTREPYALDRAEAVGLLDESSFDASEPLELIYDSANPTDGLVAQIIKANLDEVDVEVTLSPQETGVFLSRAYGLDADMVLWSTGAISPDVVDPLGVFAGGDWLFSGYETETITQQYLDYTKASTPQEKQQIVQAVQDDTLVSANVISLAEYQVLHAVSDRVSGFTAAPWGMYYWDTIKVHE